MNDFVIRVARVDEVDLFGHAHMEDDASTDARISQLSMLTSIAVDDLNSSVVTYCHSRSWERAWACMVSMWPDVGLSPRVNGWQFVGSVLTMTNGYAGVYARIEDWG